jgi:hypothetical protein
MSSIPNFTKIPPMRTKLTHTEGGQPVMTKVTDVIREYVNVPKRAVLGVLLAIEKK